MSTDNNTTLTRPIAIRLPHATLARVERLRGVMAQRSAVTEVGFSQAMQGVVGAGLDALEERLGVAGPVDVAPRVAARRAKRPRVEAKGRPVSAKIQAERDARRAAREAAGCRCKSRHVAPCVLARAKEGGA